MLIGVPRELKNHEYRVAITPAGVHELTRRGHRVLLERNAGAGSSLPDEEYRCEGATIVETADEVWAAADMVLKVKEPVAAEYHRMRADQVLFTYLHLAASRDTAKALLDARTTAIAYASALETRRAVTNADLVIGAVLVPGARAPQVVSHSDVHDMRPGSVLVDIAIDQGGCFEDSRPTTHAEPTYKVGESLFYCVTN